MFCDWYNCRQTKQGGASQLDTARLRSLITWSPEYRVDWDETPGFYAEHGVVSWGKSRRLGLLRLGRVKAYLGVQHIDPAVPGWGIVDAPEARFFLSILVSNRTVTLRSFPTMGAALSFLLSFLSQ